MTKKLTTSFKAPTSICRIFVSRKTTDQFVSGLRRKTLMNWAPKRLEFFDAAQIEAGDNWRVRIRDELSRANIFFLVLTNPAKDAFDWCLYEAGLFESLEKEDRRRIICIYADSMEGPPDQLGDIQGVKATESEILGLLMKLFHEKEFSLTEEPLNEGLTDDDLRPIALEIAADVSGVEGDQLRRREYANAYIQLLVPPGADFLLPEIVVKSDQESLKNLFGLRQKANGEQWRWEEIVNKFPQKKGRDDFNRLWTEQLGKTISAIKSNQDTRQLTGRFLARDGKLYRPEIEIYRTFENNRMTIDVTFSEQVQDSWLRDAGKEVALAANLALASRIRYELIEPYVKKVPRWRHKTSKERLFAELSRLVETIEHDGYFIGRLTQDHLLDAFEGKELDAFYAIGEEFGKEIKPLLNVALEENNVKKLLQALQRWGKNNLRFLELGLHRYEAMLGLQASESRTTPAVLVHAA